MAKDKLNAVEKSANQYGGTELRERLVHVGRTDKPVKGGGNFSFNAIFVVGDGVNRVGYGHGKAKDVQSAIAKATDAAKKNMMFVPLNGTTLQHALIGRHGATKVFMRPASDGTGVIAGGAMRAVFEVLGVENVLAKCIGSSNPFNVVRATVNGLVKMANPEKIAAKRGMTVKALVGDRDK